MTRVAATVRIAAVADLHGRLPDVPACDVLIIAGDVCPHRGRPGTRWDVIRQGKWLGTTFRRWLDAVPATHVVATWGNHDLVGHRQPGNVPRDLRWTLLVDAAATVAGLRFYGSPLTVGSALLNPWATAFTSPVGAGEPLLRDRWAAIPADTDVLVVHGPPRGCGDLTPDGVRIGSASLADRIAAVQPRLSVHGHVHGGRGLYRIGQTTVANASVLDEAYQVAGGAMAFALG